MKKNLLVLSLTLFCVGLIAQTPRMVLVEEFTGENCYPCFVNNPAFNNLLANNASKVIPIKWQVPIPNAPTTAWSLYQTNITEITWRYSTYGYGINSAPSVRIDGQYPTVFGAAGQNVSQMNNTVFNTAQSYTSAFSISMTRAWDKSCSAVDLTVTIQATAPFTSVGTLRFRTVMVEREIHFPTAPGSNGEKDFEDVAIKSFPTIQSGVSMASNWTVGQTQTFTLHCQVPSYVRDKEQVALVGFIQDDGNRKVEQAARVDEDVLPVDAASAKSPIVDVTCDDKIHPLITVLNEGQANAITNMMLTPYMDGVAGNSTNWTGNIAIGGSVQIALDPVTTPTLNGSHSFSVDITMNSTYNMVANTSKINYMVASKFDQDTIIEDFLYGIYPPPGWMVSNPDGGPTWNRTTATGSQLSFSSSKIDFYNSTLLGDKDELFLPPIDLSGGNNVELSFDVSYAQKDPASYDVLELLVSDDCGVSWFTAYTKAGPELATVTEFNFPGWVPQLESDWRTEVVPLTNYNKSNVLLKFVSTFDGGNNLYVDNVNLMQKDPVGITKTKITNLGFSVYPNPANGAAIVNIKAAKAAQGLLTVINTLGQTVYAQEVSMNEGSNTYNLDLKALSTGLYHVVISSDNGTAVKKLNVTK
jgi:hypothetical protein